MMNKQELRRYMDAQNDAGRAFSRYNRRTPISSHAPVTSVLPEGTGGETGGGCSGTFAFLGLIFGAGCFVGLAILAAHLLGR